MQDSLFKVSIRMFFGLIGLAARLLISPLWLLYVVLFVLVHSVILFWAWAHNEEERFVRYKNEFGRDMKGLIKFWHIKIMSHQDVKKR